jgi:DNA polymerase-2
MGLAFPGDDPVAGFDGARFARERHILPAVIDELWNNRDDAKRRGDEAESRAIKILMNSFYGVLGAPACRFHSPMLASSITRRGHEIITTSRDWLEERGHDVIYGDTDSLFVLLGGGHDFDACRTIGERIARELNAFWQAHIKERHGVDSRLELEFETHYRRFFMPTLRGSDEGSAKRYAGMVGDKLVIKGLEAVRTDWTALARTFQRELIRRVFEGEPFADWIRELRARLLRGELDDQLVYRKRIRRDVDDYVHNLPPHVKAAKLLDRKVRDVAYVMTTRGPQPIQKRSAPIDHGHYLARQLAPAADGILATMGTSFANIAGDQLQLFDVASNDGFGLSRPSLRRRNAMPDDNNDSDNTNSEEMMLVGSKVKAALKAAGCNSSSDVLPALNAYVGWILKQAAARAGENGRKTVRGHDILIVP